LMQFPQFIEVIIFSIGAVSEVTTRCYGMGILCNFTSCLENKLSFIQLPLAPSLLPIFVNILSSDEDENAPQSPASPRPSSSTLSRHVTKFWTFKRDCSQVLFNLSSFSSSSQGGRAESDPSMSLKAQNQINEWNNKLCSESLLSGCLFAATRCSAPQIFLKQIRRNCLRTINHLIPSLIALLSSPSPSPHNASNTQVKELRQISTTIIRELESSPPGSSAEDHLVTEILTKISTSDSMTEQRFTESEGKGSPEAIASQPAKKQSKSLSKRERNISLEREAALAMTVAEEKKTSHSRPKSKKSTGVSEI
jgi:hypothetical protein